MYIRSLNMLLKSAGGTLGTISSSSATLVDRAMMSTGKMYLYINKGKDC
jgi:hypothetical protein